MRTLSRLAVIVVLAWGSIAAGQGVHLTRAEPTVTTRVFDPARLPNPPPPLTPPEAACCVSDYQAEVEMEYSIIEEGPLPIPGRAKARITAVHARVSLAIVIWLPNNANADLKAHEEGHRVIVERIYARSDAPLNAVLAPYVGRTFDLAGADVDAAAERAVRAAGDEASRACMRVLGAEASRTGAIYDELTNHAIKKDPPAAEAVELAFEQYKKEMDPR